MAPINILFILFNNYVKLLFWRLNILKIYILFAIMVSKMSKKALALLALILIFQAILVFSSPEKCYIGEKEVPCPGSNTINQGTNVDRDWQRDLLPENFMPDERNDPLFISFFIIVLMSVIGLAFLKIKIFDKTLAEYVKPIWGYLLGAFIVASSQYLVLEMNLIMSQFSLLLRLSQGLWALLVGLGIAKLVTKENFNLKQILFAGLLFNIAIMMTKVSIRYFFYGRSIFYVVDRLLYGTILVMFVTLFVGGLLLFLKRNNYKK